MGIVYEVLDRERAELVALKTLSRVDPAGIYDLKREFRALADVRHPNVVTLHEMVSDEDQWFFTMELVLGMPFTEYVAREGWASHVDSASGLSISATRADARHARPFDEQRLRSALAQLVLGVSAIHAAGQLHRDLKPSNVLVTREGRVVVLDFGLVQDDTRSDIADTSRDDHLVVGTPAYMAPEQAAGKRASKATDWYAVGVMLYRALTGHLPLSGNLTELLLRKQTDDPVPPSALVEGLPEDLSDLAQNLLQRRPEARPAEAEIRRRLLLDAISVRPPLSIEHEGLVGREPERAWLARALDETRQGVPQVLFLEGPSGVGKTALVHDFLREVRRSPHALVLSGRCYPRETLPYKAFDALIDALSRFLSHLPEARVAELLPRNCRALTSLFPVLERVPSISAHPSLARASATPAQRRERAFAALKELLGRIADRGPLVLHMDNLEWADKDSAELLLRLCSAPDPPAFLVIGTHRPRAELQSAFFNILGGAGSKLGEALRQERSIGPLVIADAARLCATNLGCSSEVARQIALETAGDPLLLTLLCEHLRQHPERSGRTPSAHLDALIDLGVERLGREERSFLNLVVVAGAPVLPEAVGAAAGSSSERTRSSVSLLVDTGLLQIVYHRGHECVSVRHERIAQALAARLSAEEIAGYHGRWAEALVRRGDAAPDVLADHYWKAGMREPARQAAREAAGRAERGLAFDRAVHLYERALSLDPEPAERIEILERLAETRLHLGEPGNAAATLLEAARLSPPARAAELRKRSAALRLTDEQLDALFTTGGNNEGLFDGITREAVQVFLAKGQIIEAVRGARVSGPTDGPASVLLVLAGGLSVAQSGGSVELGAGEILGTLAFLHNTPRVADVHATADGTRVLSISRASLDELSQIQPQLALQLTLNLARILCGKLVNVHARAFGA
jgi:tRNA A-37 threonylcarbamoyl transferase component Bud32/tetratricopeptide (TPR) repeat protein